MLALRILFFIIVIFSVSCSHPKNSSVISKNQKNSSTTNIQCPEQRPKICTREYMPVCATRDTGVRCVTTPCPSSEQKTYGNGCSACADEMVLGYKLDACTPETPVQ